MGFYSPEYAREAEEPDALPFRKLGQCGAICWRVGSDDEIEVLLISSGDTDYWTIPKGNVHKHELLYRCAQRQALEKAGVTGRIAKTPIGNYGYRSNSWNSPVVVVHLLFVENELKNFQLQGGRQRYWLSATIAGTKVREPELKKLFNLVAGENGPKFIANIRKMILAPKTCIRTGNAL